MDWWLFDNYAWYWHLRSWLCEAKVTRCPWHRRYG